jgi:hypothetical protein
VTDPKTPSPSRLGSIFLLVNLFGFPAASFVLLPVLAWLAMAVSAPRSLHIALPVTLGLPLLVLNVWLVREAWRENAWGAEAAAMSVWTGLCLITFVVLGAFSPISLALRLATGF